MSTIKVIKASQTTHIYHYKNLKKAVLSLVIKYKIYVVLEDCFIYNNTVIINTTGCPL